MSQGRQWLSNTDRWSLLTFQKRTTKKILLPFSFAHTRRCTWFCCWWSLWSLPRAMQVKRHCFLRNIFYSPLLFAWSQRSLVVEPAIFWILWKTEKVSMLHRCTTTQHMLLVPLSSCMFLFVFFSLSCWVWIRSWKMLQTCGNSYRNRRWSSGCLCCWWSKSCLHQWCYRECLCERKIWASL